eukprot:5669159-Ditylum_brightwellii.AAC.1
MSDICCVGDIEVIPMPKPSKTTKRQKVQTQQEREQYRSLGSLGDDDDLLLEEEAKAGFDLRADQPLENTAIEVEYMPEEGDVDVKNRSVDLSVQSLDGSNHSNPSLTKTPVEKKKKKK